MSSGEQLCGFLVLHGDRSHAGRQATKAPLQTTWQGPDCFAFQNVPGTMLSGEGPIITACLQKLLVRTWSVTDGGLGGRLCPQIAKDSNSNLVGHASLSGICFLGAVGGGD